MNVCISYKNVTVQKNILFQKELTLIKHVYQKNVCFVIIGTLKMLDLDFNDMFAISRCIDDCLCNIECKSC